MKWKLGLSSTGKIINEELMRQYAENGFEIMELSLPKEEYRDADYPYFKKVADDAGIKIRSFHLPFGPSDLVNPANPDKKVSEYTIELDKFLLEKAALLGSEIAVIHTCNGPVSPEDRPVWVAQAQYTMATLAEFASQFGIQIAVENQPRAALVGSSSDILEILEADGRLGICFDVNHLMEDREDHESFVRKCGSKIVNIHVSDYDFLNERHWLPGEGKIDWQMIVRELEAVNYQGPWLYELGFNTPQTITRPRKLTCADFKRNAEEIFSGKNPTPFGTPVSGLPHWTEQQQWSMLKK